MSVRELVKAAQAEMLKGGLLPSQQREMHERLTALLGNIDEEILLADYEFSLVMRGAMETEKKANRARVIAETTEQYRRKAEAHMTKARVMEMIRTLRQNMRSLSDEMRMAG